MIEDLSQLIDSLFDAGGHVQDPEEALARCRVILERHGPACLWLTAGDQLLAARVCDARRVDEKRVVELARSGSQRALEEGDGLEADTASGLTAFTVCVGADRSGTVVFGGLLADPPAPDALEPLAAAGALTARLVRLSEEAGRYHARTRQLIAEEETLERAYAKTMSEALEEREKRFDQQKRYARRLEKEVAERSTDLREAVDRAEQASRAKSEFLANMSHEVRTPLNGVIGMIELLRKTELNERQRRYADVCKASAEALLNQINDILDFSKIEAGKLDLEQRDFDLHQVIENIRSMLEPMARTKNLQLDCWIEQRVPQRVRGDSHRLSQILINLINNAIKFTEHGGVTVRVTLDQEEDDGHMVIRCQVVDTGIGVPMERMDRLFRSFSQVDGSTTRKYGGTGLGLAISKKLARLMGGQIGVESQQNVGSTFWFTARMGPPQQQADAEGESADAPTVPATHGGSILLAEDNEVNQMVTSEMLCQSGFSCDVAVNGAQAVEAVQTKAYDLVLMDCNMPEMNGYEATGRIRELQAAGRLAREGHVPIIALTAGALKGDRERCLEAGMDDYLTKPIDPDKLAEALRRHLQSVATVSTPADASASPEPSSTPPYDRAALMKRCMDNAEFAGRLLSKFCQEAAKQIDRLEEHVTSNEAEPAALIAHSLKGSSSLIGAEAIRETAAALEAMGRSEDLSEAVSLARRLRGQFERFERYVETHRL